MVKGIAVRSDSSPCSKIMILARMVKQIIFGENAILFHYGASAAEFIHQKGKELQESLKVGREVTLDNLEMTATCRKAFNTLIYEMEENTGMNFFWLDGTVGSCMLADGAGIGNNTMTDAGPKHGNLFLN